MNQLGVRAVNHPFVRRFLKTPWFGLYSSFSEAYAAIPPRHRIGYNQDHTREIFSTYPINRVRPADYAIMLHLRNLIPPATRLIDLGGANGLACYTAQDYFNLHGNFEWVVCDVPKMIEAAKFVAQREHPRSSVLRFVTALEDAGECDIFFSSGALQFIEEPLPLLLRKLRSLPQHVLINRIPAWDNPGFVTLHDIGFCMAPYQIFNRGDFVAAMESMGYHLQDSWKCPESTFSVRLHPRIRLNAYQGFYFTRSLQTT